jgi:hypothetical protein
MTTNREWIIIILIILLLLLFFGSLSYECGCSNGGSGILGSSYDFFEAPYVIIIVELALIFLSITIVVLFYENQNEKRSQTKSPVPLPIQSNVPSKSTFSNILSSPVVQSYAAQGVDYLAKNPELLTAAFV